MNIEVLHIHKNARESIVNVHQPDKQSVSQGVSLSLCICECLHVYECMCNTATLVYTFYQTNKK